MPWYKRLVWRMFGAKRIGVDGDCYVEAYYFRDVCLITKCVCVDFPTLGEG